MANLFQTTDFQCIFLNQIIVFDYIFTEIKFCKFNDSKPGLVTVMA